MLHLNQWKNLPFSSTVKSPPNAPVIFLASLPAASPALGIRIAPFPAFPRSLFSFQIRQLFCCLPSHHFPLMSSSPWRYFAVIDLMSISFFCSLLICLLFLGLSREKPCVFGINSVYFCFLSVFYLSKLVLSVYLFQCPLGSHFPFCMELFMMAYRYAKGTMLSVSCLWLIDLWHVVGSLGDIQRLPLGPQKEALIRLERRKRKKRTVLFAHLGIIMACLITACQYSFGNCSFDIQLAIERNSEFTSLKRHSETFLVLIVECIPELIFVIITFLSLPYWNYQMRKSCRFAEAFVSSYSALKCDLIFLYFAATCSIFSLANSISSKTCALPTRNFLDSFVPHWEYVDRQVFCCGHGLFALILWGWKSDDAKVSNLVAIVCLF